jgi:hypothetical protein
MKTSEGRIAWYTRAEKAGGGVAEAKAWAIESFTSFVVKGGGAGKRILYNRIAASAASTPAANGAALRT